jgi:hypothetical protein
MFVARHVESDGGEPDVVLAVKYRYLPLRSNMGKRASLMPSVTWNAFF